MIGGSLAKGARRAELCREIVGIDRDLENLQIARELGVIDSGFENPDQIEGPFDLAVLATPVGSFAQLFEQLKPHWSKAKILTDVGSTKESVIAVAKSVFGEIPANFVPGHPIAGSEKSGVLAACDDLYRGRRVILTPLAQTDEHATRIVAEFWHKLGARVAFMDPAHHDDILAATSHLPHLVAFSLVDMLGRKDEKDEILQYAAGGFKDFTRLASSDPKMWLDICFANRSRLMRLIEEFREELTLINDVLEKQDHQRLFDIFRSANQARRRFLVRFEAE